MALAISVLAAASALQGAYADEGLAIEGLVVLTGSGQPVRRGHVDLHRVDSEERRTTVRAELGADGRFRAAGLEPGTGSGSVTASGMDSRYGISATGPESLTHSTFFFTVKLPPGEPTPEVRLEIVFPATVRGRVAPRVPAATLPAEHVLVVGATKGSARPRLVGVNPGEGPLRLKAPEGVELDLTFMALAADSTWVSHAKNVQAGRPFEITAVEGKSLRVRGAIPRDVLHGDHYMALRGATGLWPLAAGAARRRRS